MKIDKEELIQELMCITYDHLHFVQNLLHYSDDLLNDRSESNSWSILECLEHLNRYGYFYLSEIERKINSSPVSSEHVFKSGWLGNYFAQSMLPKEKLNKMKTFRSMDPIHQVLDKNVLNTFIQQQKKTLDLLQWSSKVNITRIKTSVSISRLIKLRLGDTLRVVVYHNLRHILQVKNILDIKSR